MMMNKIEKINDIEEIVDNTSIGNLAKEITESMGFKDGEEPDISDIMKPENMMNMFQTINTTLNQKINNKELDMNNLLGEASGLMNNNDMKGMMGMMGNMSGGGGNTPEGMPDLTSMMSMFQNMQQPQQPQQSQQQANKGNHDPEVVRERLRNKLNKK